MDTLERVLDKSLKIVCLVVLKIDQMYQDRLKGKAVDRTSREDFLSEISK